MHLPTGARRVDLRSSFSKSVSPAVYKAELRRHVEHVHWYLEHPTGYDKTTVNVTFACSPRPLPPWGPRRLAGVHIPSLPTGAVRAAASASPVSLRRLHSWRSAVWAIWADVLVRSEDGLVTTLLLIRRVHLPSEPRPLLEQPPA